MKNISKRESKIQIASALSPNLIPEVEDVEAAAQRHETKLRKRSTDAHDDYFEKGDSGGDGDGGDYYEKKDWSDLFRAANPSSKVTPEHLKHPELYDIDGVLIHPPNEHITLKKEKETTAMTKEDRHKKTTTRQ